MNQQTQRPTYNPGRQVGFTEQGTPVLEYYRQQTPQPVSKPTKPLKTFAAGQVRAVIWEHNAQAHRKDGTPYVRTSHNIQIERRYKAQEGWRSTSTFFLDDLQKIEVVVRQAQEYLLTSEKPGEDA